MWALPSIILLRGRSPEQPSKVKSAATVNFELAESPKATKIERTNIHLPTHQPSHIQTYRAEQSRAHAIQSVPKSPIGNVFPLSSLAARGFSSSLQLLYCDLGFPFLFSNWTDQQTATDDDDQQRESFRGGWRHEA